VRLRRGWPLVLFVVLLVAVPTFEVWLLIEVGQQLGWVPTIAILVAEAVAGAWLMRHEGNRAWKALMDAMSTGKVPSGELADAALILVGGVLLMLPGFLTDVAGFIFLLRWTRPIGRKLIAFFVARRLNRLGIPVARARVDRSNLIEGETVTEPTAPGSRGAGKDGPIVIAGEIEEPRGS
jgi:UPF0716 protein FxsA